MRKGILTISIFLSIFMGFCIIPLALQAHSSPYYHCHWNHGIRTCHGGGSHHRHHHCYWKNGVKHCYWK